jgi:hypothetical protein
MPLADFVFTDRARPIVELGIGNSSIGGTSGVWDVSRWDTAPAYWAASEPSWYDITCDTISVECAYGRPRTIDRFVAGTATVIVDNASGWADPANSDAPGELTVRPGRAIRFGVEHVELGVCWLFRGIVDAMTPTYHPTAHDAVQLNVVDALGEVNRAKMIPLTAPVGAGETSTARVGRILSRALWPSSKRDLWPSSTKLVASDIGGQAADLLGVVAESEGGAVFGDLDGNIAFRGRDWQTYTTGTPPDATIGNVDPTDVCPSEWRRPFERADIATRVILGRANEPASLIEVDDPAGMALYGIEPFERTYLLTQSSTRMADLAARILQTRSYLTAPRVRAVTLSAATSDGALDLMSTVDVYKPSRYRCRLAYDPPRGLVFDDEYMATAVSHRIDASAWDLEVNLDLAAPYAAVGGRWDSAQWDQALWHGMTSLLRDAYQLRDDLTGASR